MRSLLLSQGHRQALRAGGPWARPLVALHLQGIGANDLCARQTYRIRSECHGPSSEIGGGSRRHREQAAVPQFLILFRCLTHQYYFVVVAGILCAWYCGDIPKRRKRCLDGYFSKLLARKRG